MQIRPIQDVEAAQEFEGFSPEERSLFYGCLDVLLEEGRTPIEAEREAAALILRARGKKELPDKALHWCLRREKAYRQQGMSCEEAERATLNELERHRAKQGGQ